MKRFVNKIMTGVGCVIFLLFVHSTIFAQTECCKQCEAEMNRALEANNKEWWDAAHNGASFDVLVKIQSKVDNEIKNNYFNCIDRCSQQAQQTESQAVQKRTASANTDMQVFAPAQGGVAVDNGGGISTQSYRGRAATNSSSSSNGLQRNSDNMRVQAENTHNAMMDIWNKARQRDEERRKHVEQRAATMDAANMQTISNEVRGVRDAIDASRDTKEQVKNADNLSRIHQINKNNMSENLPDMQMDRDLWNAPNTNQGQHFGRLDGQDAVKKGDNAVRNPYRGRALNATTANLEYNKTKAEEWDEQHSQDKQESNAGNVPSGSPNIVTPPNGGGYSSNSGASTTQNGTDAIDAFYQKGSQYLSHSGNSNVSATANKSSSNIATSTTDNNAQQTTTQIDQSDTSHPEYDIYSRDGHIDKQRLFEEPSYIRHQTEEEQQKIKEKAQNTTGVYYAVQVEGEGGATYYTLDEKEAEQLKEAIENQKVTKFSGGKPLTEDFQKRTVNDMSAEAMGGSKTNVDRDLGELKESLKSMKSEESLIPTRYKAHIDTVAIQQFKPKSDSASAASAYNNGSSAQQLKTPVSATDKSLQGGFSDGGTRLNEGSGNNAVKSK